MVSDPVCVTYQIDEDEFLKACHVLWDHQAIGHRGNVKTGFGLAALGLFFAIYGHIDLISYFLIGGGIILACMSQIRGLLWRRFYSRIDKYRGPITTTFRDADIEVVAHHETSLLAWSTFTGYVETPAFLFLLVDSKQFSVIPMDAFDRPGDVDDVLELVSEKLPKVQKRRM